jgi:hypothetical protein
MRRIYIIFVLGLCFGCDSETDSQVDGGVTDAGPEYGDPVSPEGHLLIEELYYAGSPPAAGSDHYNADQFIEIVNTSDAPVAVGGLFIGNVYGLAGEINAGYTPNSFAESDPDRVYCENLWRIPGEPEDVLLYPDESLIIAQDGANHQPFSTVDLTGANWEAYVEQSERDEDYPLVDNLEAFHFTGGYDWLITVFGPSVVILSPEAIDHMEDVTADQFWELKAIPVEYIVDAVETLMDASSGIYKRLPANVDTGFVYVSDTYSGESVRRVREDGLLKDTGNSSADFEVATPAPYEF